MRDKSPICILLTLLLLFGFLRGVDALSTDFSFQSAGVTINLTFPDEAHPKESLTHNVTITANTALTLHNFTLVIKAQVNSSWQEIKKIGPITSLPLGENQNLTSSIKFTLPQYTDGRLRCFIYVLTNLFADPSSYTFYTTSVRTLTYSELLSAHNELLANYSDLLEEHNALWADYNDLLADYETLLESYNKLLAEYGNLNMTYNELSTKYSDLDKNYNELSTKYGKSISTYNELLNDYNVLRSDYNSLNLTHSSLQTTYSSLGAEYNSLNQIYNALNVSYTDLENVVDGLHRRIDASEIELTQARIIMTIFMGASVALIFLIAYIKKKKQEPYVIIRKETVSVKPDES